MACTKKHFKKVPGYPCIFASETGLIKHNEDLIYQFEKNQQGHMAVTLPLSCRVDGTESYRYVHRLVALAYVFNPCPGVFRIVDHVDGDSGNNDASNLRWCTQQMNCMNRRNSRNAIFVQKFRVFFTKHGRRCSFMKKWRDGRGRWQSSVSVRGKRHQLGYHKTFLDAHNAANEFREQEFERIYAEHKRDAARRTASYVSWLP